ncbi:hypothetical protein Rxyl_1909 [Rubrobacter xylanophilus DSM 9941]|uniref:Uncharacterized protein n=1 Tax=Rubrobacter xylanophilus (strain DSM 9941 / JCM 11954 / NBRC 16129 / PRD-1) TaxID=266117 RepID=Q1AUS2_RUBXD|nr:hypothetical protein Rxyl_1909 [Rubrobacter xylanophilus DSM 9941]
MPRAASGWRGVRVGCPKRLSRLLMALSLTLSWLTLMGLPEGGAVPEGFRSSVSAWGRASVISMALTLLEKLGNLLLRCLYPNQRAPGRWGCVRSGTALDSYLEFGVQYLNNQCYNCKLM